MIQSSIDVRDFNFPHKSISDRNRSPTNIAYFIHQGTWEHHIQVFCQNRKFGTKKILRSVLIGQNIFLNVPILSGNMQNRTGFLRQMKKFSIRTERSLVPCHISYLVGFTNACYYQSCGLRSCMKCK